MHWIRLITVHNCIFKFKQLQKCQYCQLCVLCSQAFWPRHFSWNQQSRQLHTSLEPSNHSGLTEYKYSCLVFIHIYCLNRWIQQNKTQTQTTTMEWFLYLCDTLNRSSFMHGSYSSNISKFFNLKKKSRMFSNNSFSTFLVQSPSFGTHMTRQISYFLFQKIKTHVLEGWSSVISNQKKRQWKVTWIYLLKRYFGQEIMIEIAHRQTFLQTILKHNHKKDCLWIFQISTMSQSLTLSIPWDPVK